MSDTPTVAPHHEVFPNAPLQLVAVEITYPVTNLTVDTALFAALEGVLGAPAQTQFGGQLRVNGQPGPDGSLPGESMLFRMTNPDRTLSVSAWPTSLVVESSDYTRYETFRDLLRELVDAYARYMAPAAVTRFGIRYIDEMHVDSPVASVADWLPYVNPLLLAPASLVSDQVTNLATGFAVDLGGDQTVNVRCATAPSRALTSEGDLRLRDRPATPALILDIDAVYQPTAQPMDRAVTGAVVVALADSLRPGVRRVFDAVFTEAALTTFRTPQETT